MAKRKTQGQLLDKWIADVRRLAKGRSPRLPGEKTRRSRFVRPFRERFRRFLLHPRAQEADADQSHA